MQQTNQLPHPAPADGRGSLKRSASNGESAPYQTIRSQADCHHHGFVACRHWVLSFPPLL